MTSQPQRNRARLTPADLRSHMEADSRRLLEAVPDAMLITDRAGIIVAANPRAEELFGYARFELALKPLELLIPERFRQKHQDHEANFFIDPHARSLGRGRDLVGLRKDGTEIPLEISLHPIHEDTDAIGCVVLCVDITERKRADEALKQSEERYRMLVEISPDAIYVQQDRKVVFVNPTCLRLLRAEAPAQIIGKSVFDVIHANYHEAVNRRIEDNLKGRSVPPMAQQWNRLDGSLIDVEVVATPFTWKGRPAVQVVARDISERKRQEEERDKLLAILDQSPDLIGLADTDGTVLYVNQTGRRMIGLDGDKEAAGRNMCDFIAPLEPLQTRQGIVSAMRAGQVSQREMVVTHFGGGDPVQLEVRAFGIFDRSGKLIGFANVSRDISERKRAEEALRRSEERYRLLFESNPQPMWVYHLATLRFLAVNQAAVEHYGYSRSEFLSMTLRDIRPPEDIPALEQSIFDAANSIDRAGIWRHRTKFGRIIYVEITETHIEFEGKAAALILANDVTERVQAEETLRLHAAALEAAANSIVITDTGGNIQWVNPAFERLTGYSAGEIIGKNPRILQSGRHDASFYKAMWDSILAGQVWEGEIINRRKDGSLYAEHQTITPVRDANGNITDFVGVKEDITARKRGEEALQASEAAYRSIIEGAPYGIYRVRQDGRILMANPALAKMLGYESPAELVGRNTITDLYLSPEERELSAARWRGKETVMPYEVTWKCKGGKHIVVRLAGRMWHEEKDTLPSYEVFVEDMTERRSLEEQFRQAQKMEAVGRLAGGVAHDFNNLLMIISSYAQLIPEHLSDGTKVEKHAQHIAEAASRATAVTQQLLAFSRKQVMQPTTLSLNELTLGLSKMLPTLLGEDIEMAVVPGATWKVRADASQIEQVIMNLAVNARDAMPEGGKLIIEISDVVLDRDYSKRHGIEVPPGEYVMLAVSDTGMGMDGKTQARIFEPFFTTKAVGKGTGLGLATAYGIVKQSGGFIWVYSEVGKGSTFKIYLPRVEEPEDQRTQRLSTGPAPRGSEAILLVEDEDALRTVTSEYLQSLGYVVLGARNAEDALRIIRERVDPIHVLITDMVMPGIGGPQLAKAAQELRPGLRVIYVSGYTDRAMDRSAIGPDAVFLQKPFNLNALAVKLRDLLGDSIRNPAEPS